MSGAKISEVLREAARYLCTPGISMGRAACGAIRIVAGYGYGSGPALAFFTEYFKPEDCHVDDIWFGEITPINQDCRIVALLFAAAIAESEGK